MNAVTHTLRRPGRRRAELDPFAVEADVASGASYGCVDWYAYGGEAHAARARTQLAQLRVARAGLLLAAPLALQARTQRH
jgi:hypothetical protein